MPPILADPYFWLAALPAILLLGLSKGGFVGISVLGAPLLALVVPPVQAAAILLPILIVQDVVGVSANWRHVDWSVVRTVLSGALIGTLLGTFFAAGVPGAAVKLIVGAIGLAFALNWWFGLVRRVAAARRPTKAEGVFWGTVSGFTSFIAHAGGPPFQVYVLPQGLDRDRLVGSTLWYFAIVNWVKVPPYIWLGQFTRETLLIGAALAPFAVAATLLGVWLVRKVETERFYKLVYGLLVVVSIKLLVDAVREW